MVTAAKRVLSILSIAEKWDFTKLATTFSVGLVLAGGFWGWTAPASAAPFAYISNFGGNSVSVIDIANNTVIATVPVGSLPRNVAVHPAGSHVYVTTKDATGSSVSVIETSTNKVTATIKVGAFPSSLGVAVHPNGTRVYVTNYSNSTVSVIDTTINAVIDSIAVGNGPLEIAVAPNGARIYVSHNSSNSVSVIDTLTNSVTIVPVGLSPWELVVSPDSKRVYVVAGLGLSVIDAASNTVTTTPVFGSASEGVAINPAGTRVYVTSEQSLITGDRGAVSVIDTGTNTVLATISVGQRPSGVSVSPDGNRVYVANQLSNTVSVIDTATNTVATTIVVGSQPVAYGQFITPSNPQVCNPPEFVYADNSGAFGLFEGTVESSPVDDVTTVHFKIEPTEVIFNPFTYGQRALALWFSIQQITVEGGVQKVEANLDDVVGGPAAEAGLIPPNGRASFVAEFCTPGTITLNLNYDNKASAVTLAEVLLLTPIRLSTALDFGEELLKVPLYNSAVIHYVNAWQITPGTSLGEALRNVSRELILAGRDLIALRRNAQQWEQLLNVFRKFEYDFLVRQLLTRIVLAPARLFEIQLDAITTWIQTGGANPDGLLEIKIVGQ